MLVDDLVLSKSLGKGSFGEVFLTKKVRGTELYATKRMDRAEYSKPENNKRLINEISILQKIKHPNIVRLIEVKKTKSHIYIVTEFCNGGSLSENLNKYIKANKKPFSEEIVQYLMRQLVSAINYLHKNKIIHRDLKLDNILINFPTEKDKTDLNMLAAQIKIIDFGFATRLRTANQNLTKTVLGTPSNIYPKLLNNMERHQNSLEGYDEKVDIWSLGTLCYEMIVGRLTFFGRNMNELYEKVKRGNYKLPLWLSKEAVSFLNGMLQYDSKRRLSSDDLLRHDFLTKNVKDFQSVDKNQLKGKINGNMMNINIKNNNTIWGIFNENHNDINDNVPLSEEEGIKNFETMPNTEGMGEKFLNNNDNKILNNNKINNNNNNNKINNNNIQSKNPNTFSNVSSFAVVNEIKNVDTTNQINHLNNNQKIIPGNNPLIQKNHQIKPNINNKNPQLLNTTFPSRQFDRQHTFDNNMNLLNQNNKKMPHNQNPLYRTNINQQNQNQNHQNKAPHPLQKRYTLQNNPNQVNNIYNNFNAQQKLPNMSQMNEFCKIKSNALNEFL